MSNEVYHLNWIFPNPGLADHNVLIRSHQPDAPPTMYGRRCLTIFTSSAYRHYISERTIALVDLRKVVKSMDDIEIEIV